MNRIATRALAVLLLAAVLLGGMGFFLVEYSQNASKWVVFDGSPHVYKGDNINCGVTTDRSGILLLDSRQERTYSSDSVLRKATIHLLGDRYGNVSAPALSYFAAQIAGYDSLNGVYAYGDTAGAARLTISAQVQKTAFQAMGERKGVVAVYNYQTGEILCAVSTPGFDPDHVPDLTGADAALYEGMYLNRFTQSCYVPGSIFKVVTLAAALEELPDLEQLQFTCTGAYEMGADSITCEAVHGTQNIQQAFQNSCNCAFAQLSERLGGERLARYVKRFGVTASQSFDGITTATGNFEAAPERVNVAWSAIGQYTDQINPCAFLTYMGAIAAGGKGVSPYLVADISVGSDKTYQARTRELERIMSPQTAEALTSYLRLNVQNRYGDLNFPGLEVCAKTGTAEVGGGKKPNAMLAGFVQNPEYPLAFVVCVEDGGYGSTVCLPIASQVLAACREAPDQE